MIKPEEIKSSISELRRKTKVGDKADVVVGVTVFYEWTNGIDRAGNTFVTYDFEDDFDPDSKDFTSFGELTKSQVTEWIEPLEAVRMDGIISSIEAQIQENYFPEYVVESPEWDENDQISVKQA